MLFSFTGWFKTNIIGRGRKQSRSAARPRHTTRLGVELLEDRLQPAAFTPLASFLTPPASFGPHGATTVAAQTKASGGILKASAGSLNDGKALKAATAVVVTRVLRADGKWVQKVT